MESKSQDSIQVCIRIRPDRDDDNIVSYSDTEVTLDKNRFCFDKIFPPSASQDNIFEAVGLKVIAHTLDGYNGCIFVYGQTGSGKTYTMMGDNNGLMQKSFVSIFSQIESKHQIQCLMTCSYYQIYNEQIIDLLDTKRDKRLQIRQDSKKGVFVENLTEENVYSSHKLLECLGMGMKNRHVGETQMNRQSSRSHSIFTISLSIQTEINGMKVLKSPKLHFVDLAGSQRQKMTAASGDRLKEAGNINKSLTTLGMVINALTSQKTKSHIPYRDSKLTSLLRDSLGGNSKTFLIATIARSMMCFQQTLSTLNFANRAKMVKVKALINQQSLSNNIQVFKQQIRRLKTQIARLKSQNIPHHQPPKFSLKQIQSCNYDSQFKQINSKINTIHENITSGALSPALEQILAVLQKQRNRDDDCMEEEYEDGDGEQALMGYLSNNSKMLERIHEKIEEYSALKQQLFSKVYSQQMYINQLKTPSKFQRDQYQQLLQKKNKQLDKLTNQLKSLQIQHTQKELLIQQLELTSTTKSSSLEQHAETITTIQSENSCLRKETFSLKNLLNQANQELQQIHRRLQESQEQCKENKQLYLYAEQNYETERELRGQVQGNLQQKVCQIQRERERYEGLLEEKREYYEELEESLRGELNVLQQTIQFNDKKISQCQTLIRNLKSQNTQISQQNIHNLHTIHNLQQKVQNLTTNTNQLLILKDTLSIKLLNTQLTKQQLAFQNGMIQSSSFRAYFENVVKFGEMEEEREEKENVLGRIVEEKEGLVTKLRGNIGEYNNKIEEYQQRVRQLQQQKSNIMHQHESQKQSLLTLHTHNLTTLQQTYTQQITQHNQTIQHHQQTITNLQQTTTLLQQQTINLHKQLQQQKTFIQNLQQTHINQISKFQQQTTKILSEQEKLRIENQEMKRTYKSIIRENYKLKNRYSCEGKKEADNLVAKLEFYEEKFKLMSIDYNQAQEIVQKSKLKQLTLLQKIAYLQQNKKLSTINHDIDITAILSENKELKQQLSSYKSIQPTNNKYKQQAINSYSKKLSNNCQQKQQQLQQKQIHFKNKLVKAIEKFNHPKENMDMEEFGGKGLDQLIGIWEELEEQNVKQFQAVSRGIKKEQKLKVQNNCIVKENLYLKEAITALQKQLEEGGVPRKLVKMERHVSC